jgi:hypothetical protein
MIATSCNTQEVPKSVAGIYLGKCKVESRYKKDGQYIFFQDTVDVQLNIHESNEISGIVGGAIFEGCSIRNNRGWLGRTLNLKTDYVIRGNLSGKTFSRDTIQVKAISLPFNVDDKVLDGSLFIGGGFDLFPIISHFHLYKE